MRGGRGGGGGECEAFDNCVPGFFPLYHGMRCTKQRFNAIHHIVWFILQLDVVSSEKQHSTKKAKY